MRHRHSPLSWLAPWAAVVGCLLLAQSDTSAGQQENPQQEIQRLQQKLDEQARVIQKLRAELLQSQQERAVFVERLTKVLGELQKAQRKLARMQQGGGDEVRLPVNKPENNPPKRFVRGTVEKVSATDKSLMQIDIGSNDGLRKGHTLELYRLKPEAKYLGRVRVLEVDVRNSVVRALPAAKGRQVEARPGDEVSSTFLPEEEKK